MFPIAVASCFIAGTAAVVSAFCQTIDSLIELWFYVPLHIEYVISEKFIL